MFCVFSALISQNTSPEKISCGQRLGSYIQCHDDGQSSLSIDNTTRKYCSCSALRSYQHEFEHTSHQVPVVRNSSGHKKL